MDCAAGLIPALCKGSGGQHQLGMYPVTSDFFFCFFFLSFHLFLWYFPFPYSCVFTGLHAICGDVCQLLFISFLLFSLKSYYRSDSIPELLLTLLSSWKHSVKPRPAVSYVNCRPGQAAAVCSLSLCMRSHLSPICSFTPAVTDQETDWRVFVKLDSP